MGIWGGAPSGVHGLSPWSEGQEGEAPEDDDRYIIYNK